MIKDLRIMGICPLCDGEVDEKQFKIYKGQYVHIKCFKDQIGYPLWWKPKKSRPTSGTFGSPGEHSKSRVDQRKHNKFHKKGD